jgi:hypothetical protein
MSLSAWFGAARTKGKQKCLMYATVFIWRAAEYSNPQEMPICQPNRRRENNQVAYKMTIARNIR